MVSTTSPFRDTVAFAAGCGLAAATRAAVGERAPERSAPLAAAGLVGAALVYPLARRRQAHDRARDAVEWTTVAVTTAFAGLALRRQPRPALAAIAAGWAAHALFDLLAGTGPDSRLPSWYPALCAGYDVALAAALGRDARDPRSA